MSKSKDERKELHFTSVQDGNERQHLIDGLKQGGWMRDEFEKQDGLENKKKWLKALGLILVDEPMPLLDTDESTAKQRKEEDNKREARR